MHDLLRQIDKANEAGLYYMALFGALALPDICGAMEKENGEADGAGNTYRKWIAENEPFWAGENGPEVIWNYRCGFFHQGRLVPRKERRLPRMIFIEPGASTWGMHGILHEIDGELAAHVDVQAFCYQFTDAARKWYLRKRNDPIVRRNLERMVRRYPDGLAPFTSGAAVIA